MTNTLEFTQVKKYIESLSKEKNEKEVYELLSLICQKSNVYDIESQYSYAIGRVVEGEQMTLKELVSKGYNNTIFKNKYGNEYNYSESTFSDEQLSKMVEVYSIYQDNNGYTVVVAKELKVPKASEEYVRRLFVPQVHCKRCEGHVLKSLNKNYAYQCLDCDEDLYECETYIEENEDKNLSKEVLNDLAIKAHNLECVFKKGVK